MLHGPEGSAVVSLNRRHDTPQLTSMPGERITTCNVSLGVPLPCMRDKCIMVKSGSMKQNTYPCCPLSRIAVMSMIRMIRYATMEHM